MKRRSFIFGTAAMAVPLPGRTAGAGRWVDALSHAGNETGESPVPAPGESGTATTGLTFDEVERTGHEVTYEEVADVFGGPMSKHPVVSVKAHPEIVWVRPDMGIGTIANPFAFGVGDPARRIRWREVKRSLMKGYLPIVVSRWQDGPVLFEQLAFASLLEDLMVLLSTNNCPLMERVHSHQLLVDALAGSDEKQVIQATWEHTNNSWSEWIRFIPLEKEAEEFRA
jgi:hypothetical protein